MTNARRMVAVVGNLGLHPICKLSVPARRLLVFLALNNGHSLRRDAAASLWPDHPEEIGRANLRRAIWLLPPKWVVSDHDTIELDAVIDYDDAKKSACNAIQGSALSLDEINLLSQDILPGWHEEWIIPRQDAFRLLRVQALEAACVTMATKGHFALATQAGAAALAAEPLRESAAEALINAHLAQRNRHEAATCFRNFAARLEEELGVAPDPMLSQRFAMLSMTPNGTH